VDNEKIPQHPNSFTASTADFPQRSHVSGTDIAE
jgi:hypothetical protein